MPALLKTTPPRLWIAIGLSQWRIRAAWIALPLEVFAAAVPFLTIIPSYAPPPQLAALPAHATPLSAHFGEIGLLGYNTENRRYAPGDLVPLTLFWRPDAPSKTDLSLFINLMNSGESLLATLPTYPGWGSLRTSTWATGVVHQDHYFVRLPADTAGAGVLRVHIGWWKYPDGWDVKATDDSGNPLDPLFISIGAYGAAQHAEAQAFTPYFLGAFPAPTTP